MNGIEKIISCMESDALAEREAIRAEAEAKAADILHEYQSSALALTREGESKREVQMRELAERLDGSSQMACRQRVLAAKQEVIDTAFARAAEALLQLPRERYIDLLASLAAESGSEGAELILSAADRASVGQAVVDAANARVGGERFTLAKETRELGGGLVLRRGKIEINCGFGEKLRRLRQEEASALAKLLFA